MSLAPWALGLLWGRMIVPAEKLPVTFASEGLSIRFRPRRRRKPKPEGVVSFRYPYDLPNEIVYKDLDQVGRALIKEINLHPWMSSTDYCAGIRTGPPGERINAVEPLEGRQSQDGCPALGFLCGADQAQAALEAGPGRPGQVVCRVAAPDGAEPDLVLSEPESLLPAAVSRLGAAGGRDGESGL